MSYMDPMGMVHFSVKTPRDHSHQPAKICWVKELRVGWMAFQRPGERGSLQPGRWESLVSFFQNHVFSMFLKTDL